MAPKSSLLGLFLFISIALAGCAPGGISPTVDPKVVGTSVAATLDAVATLTQRAVLTSRPTDTLTPAPAPTQTVTPLPSVPPVASPTSTTSVPSAPGVMIAYTKYSDVYLWTEAGGITRLTDMHDVVSVRLSSDGALIAFMRQDPAEVTLQELWVVNTSGLPNPRSLVSAADLSALVPPGAGSSVLGYGVLQYAFRPGTHQLAYNTMILHVGPGFGPNHDLRLVDADSLQKITLFETGQGGLFYYSPDGSQIALSNPESISLVNADGTNLRPAVLTFPRVITYSEYEYHPHPIWAADSTSLAVAIPPHDPLGDPAPVTGLWRIPADGSPAVLLGSVPAIAFAWPDSAFSPDLARVAYSSDAAGAGVNMRDLHISQPDGSADQIYATGESLEFISWAPDSQHFMYKIQGGDKEGFYIGGLDETPILFIEVPQRVRETQWQDGTRFVLFVNNNNQWGLLLCSVDGDILSSIDTVPDSSPHFDLLP